MEDMQSVEDERIVPELVMPSDGLTSEPMTPEQAVKLRPLAKTFKAGSGYSNDLYIEVVRQVHETRTGRTHIERDFPNVSPGHVATVLRRQADLKGFAVAVATTADEGISAMYVGDTALTS
jgi:hypothetical protein